MKIRLDPPAPKGWGLCGLDARPGATGIGGLGARWARVREARCDWSTYVASDDLAAERRRLAAAVDHLRRTASQDRENVNNVTGRVAVEQQDAMLRDFDGAVVVVSHGRSCSRPLRVRCGCSDGTEDCREALRRPVRELRVARHRRPLPPRRRSPSRRSSLRGRGR